MNFENIEGLNENDLDSLYNDIIEYGHDDNLSSVCFYGYATGSRSGYCQGYYASIVPQVGWNCWGCQIGNVNRNVFCADYNITGGLYSFYGNCDHSF